MGAVKFLTKPLDFDALLGGLRVFLTLPSEFHPRVPAPHAAAAP